MINCVVTSKTGTLITPLPASIYDLYEKLYSVGIKRSPAEVYLDDSEEAKIHVQLQGDTLEDGHLLHLLDDRNTLHDANLLIYRVENASADIKPELHDKILNDYYVGVEDAIMGIGLPIYFTNFMMLCCRNISAQ